MKRTFPLFALAAVGMIAHVSGAVVINGATGNGGFVATTANTNTTSISGWSSDTAFWVDSGNTTLNTIPFGADTVANSHFIQLHNGAGSVLTSSSLFSLAAGEGLNLSFDLKAAGTLADTTLTVSIVDTVNLTTLHTFSTVFNTATTGATFTQQNLSASGLSAGSNLALRYTLSSGGKDFHIDRVFLETVPVPEPSIAFLGGLGLLGLIRRRR